MSHRILAVFLTACAFAIPIQAQELRGSVRGTITDSSGSVVAGAQVTLRNVATGVQNARASSATGDYLFDFVTAGTYSLTV